MLQRRRPEPGRFFFLSFTPEGRVQIYQESEVLHLFSIVGFIYKFQCVERAAEHSESTTAGHTTTGQSLLIPSLESDLISSGVETRFQQLQQEERRRLLSVLLLPWSTVISLKRNEEDFKKHWD